MAFRLTSENVIFRSYLDRTGYIFDEETYLKVDPSLQVLLKGSERIFNVLHLPLIRGL